MATSLKHLQTLLDFGEDDLTANRRGKLSKGQIDYLQRQAMHEIHAVMIIPFLLAMAILMTLSFWTAVPVLVVLGLIMVGLYQFHQQSLDEIKQKKVISVVGRLSKVAKSSSITHYAISVNDERFAVDRDFYYQIMEGDYTLYLLADTRQILGIEPGKKASGTTPTKSASPARKTTTTSTRPVASKTTPAPKTSTSPAKSTTRPSTATASKAQSTSGDKPAKPKGIVPKPTTTRTRSTTTTSSRAR